MNDKIEPKLFDYTHPVSLFILEWWENLKRNKGDRAELRRCKNLEAVQKTSAFQRCYWKLIKYFDSPKIIPSREQMAIIIGLAAHIEDNDNEKKDDQFDYQEHDYFGYQLGRGDNSPKLSELRFRRLLKIRDRGKLFLFLIQVIRLLDKKVNILDLQRISYFWGEKQKTNLAYKYYEKAKLETNR